VTKEGQFRRSVILPWSTIVLIGGEHCKLLLINRTYNRPYNNNFVNELKHILIIVQYLEYSSTVA